MRPPEHQLSVVSYLMSHIPVDLRLHIVHQPLPVPEEDIGVEIVIVLQTTGLGSDRMGSLISVDAEGTDAELDVVTLRMVCDRSRISWVTLFLRQSSLEAKA